MINLQCCVGISVCACVCVCNCVCMCVCVCMLMCEPVVAPAFLHVASDCVCVHCSVVQYVCVVCDVYRV